MLRLQSLNQINLPGVTQSPTKPSRYNSTESKTANNAICRHLIQSKLLVRILLLFLGVAAFLATGALQRQGLPLVDFEQMNVVTYYPGASPEDVEINITIKLEEAIREVDGIEKFTSISAEGASRIKVFVDPDADNPAEVKAEIRRAVESVSDLPTEMDSDPMVTEAKIANRSIYEAALIMPGSNDRMTLRKHAKALKKAHEAIRRL